MNITIGRKLMIISPGRVMSATVTYADESEVILGEGEVIIMFDSGLGGRGITVMENGRALSPHEIVDQLN